MTCTKVGCQVEDVEESRIGGIVIVACHAHSNDLRTDGEVNAMFRRQQKLARQFAILLDALKGPCADTQHCMRKLDELMEAEENLQESVETWLNTAAGRPS